MKTPVIAVRKRSNPEACSGKALDCFVAEPVIGRAFVRPVGSSQWRLHNHDDGGDCGGAEG
jgi:hypothetical protein